MSHVVQNAKSNIKVRNLMNIRAGAGEKFKKYDNIKIDILTKLLPIFSFIASFILLYFLYPKSFDGDPSWEGYYQGRFYYIFFLWLVSLEMILEWEKLKANRLNKLRSRRTFVFILALTLPLFYVVAANYWGLNSAITDIATLNNVPHANLMPLVTEYLVFPSLFCLIVLLAYGINRLTEFSMSVFFLGIIGLVYTIDNLYPVGRFTPFQALVTPTTILAAKGLNLMGYGTLITQFVSPDYGWMTILRVWDTNNMLRATEFGIAWPCAGVEGLILYTIIVLLFLKKMNIPSWQKITYFTIGAVVTYSVNVLRIMSIFIIGINSGNSAPAILQFHNLYGPLYSLSWIIAYPLIIIGSRDLWGRIRKT